MISFWPINDPATVASCHGTPITHASGEKIQPRIICLSLIHIYDKTVSTAIVLAALNSLGVTAEASGRNDLVVKTDSGDRKVSGSAYRETMDRGFHHGTQMCIRDSP